MNKTLLIISGIYNLLFAIFHLLFWKIFDWKNDLASLSSVNRAIVQVINFCLTVEELGQLGFLIRFPDRDRFVQRGLFHWMIDSSK